MKLKFIQNQESTIQITVLVGTAKLCKVLRRVFAAKKDKFVAIL